MSSPPAWTMGTSKRGTSYQFVDVPGPGTYAADFNQSSPSWKIGTADRQKDTFRVSPGPGAYDSPGRYSKTTPMYTFGLKTSRSEARLVPGPGTYNQERLKGDDRKAPAFTMRIKTPLYRVTEESPGPGAYDQSSRVLSIRSATFKIGTANRKSLHESENVPGPGTYVSNVAVLCKTDNGPRWSFGSTVRGSVNYAAKFQPGPGSYNTGYKYSVGDGVTMKSRRPDTSTSKFAKLPGPGAYDPLTSTKKRSPSIRIGSAPRSINPRSRNQTPGPGEYSPVSAGRRGNMRIGSSERKPLNDRATTPGPGAYEHTLNISHGPQIGMVPRRENSVQLQRDRSTPGPGAYTPEVELVRKKFPNIGTANRSNSEHLETVPGPGTYDTRKNFIGPKWGFGTEMRGQSLSSSTLPGPGAYNIPEKFADVPKYALGV